MATVRMRHPKLAREMDFPAESAKHHVRAGWRVVENPKPLTPEPGPLPTVEPQATDVDTSEKPSRKRRRSSDNEES